MKNRISRIGIDEARDLSGDPDYLPPIDLDEIAYGRTRTPRGGEDDFRATLRELEERELRPLEHPVCDRAALFWSALAAVSAIELLIAWALLRGWL